MFGIAASSLSKLVFEEHQTLQQYCVACQSLGRFCQCIFAPVDRPKLFKLVTGHQ